MPNTRIVRSMKSSGLKKVAIGEGNGDVASQGLKEDFNSTYPANQTNIVDLDVTDSAPINEKYRAALPNTPTPLGSVNLGPVSSGEKK